MDFIKNTIIRIICDHTGEGNNELLSSMDDDGNLILNKVDYRISISTIEAYFDVDLFMLMNNSTCINIDNLANNIRTIKKWKYRG